MKAQDISWSFADLCSAKHAVQFDSHSLGRRPLPKACQVFELVCVQVRFETFTVL
jgi:hypothetical protein